LPLTSAIPFVSSAALRATLKGLRGQIKGAHARAVHRKMQMIFRTAQQISH
jgi:hypothetical protein